VRSASHTDQSSGVVADERRREDSQPGGEWEVRRAHEASGRSREGTPPANRNSLDGRDGNSRFVVAGGRLWPFSAIVACLAVPAADRCPDTAFEETGPAAGRSRGTSPKGDLGLACVHFSSLGISSANTTPLITVTMPTSRYLSALGQSSLVGQADRRTVADPLFLMNE